jgi:hypothetical protein
MSRPAVKARNPAPDKKEMEDVDILQFQEEEFKTKHVVLVIVPSLFRLVGPSFIGPEKKVVVLVTCSKLQQTICFVFHQFTPVIVIRAWSLTCIGLLGQLLIELDVCHQKEKENVPVQT